MRSFTRLLTAMAIGLPALMPATAWAHRLWLLPSATSFSGEDPWVSVDAAISNDLFFADHFPMNLAQIKVEAPDGSAGAIDHAATGRYRSTFDVHLTQPGTWKIGLDGTNVTGSFTVDGVAHRVGRRGGPGGPGGAGSQGRGPGQEGAMRRDGAGERAGDRGGDRADERGGERGGNGPAFAGPPVSVEEIPANATDVKLTETISRNEIYVTRGQTTLKVFIPTNKGLELSPITHPDDLVAGTAAKFRFLVDGKPAPGLKLTIIPGGKRYRDAEGGFDAVTDGEGVATITFPSAGMFWLNATVTDDHPSLARATERRLSYTATLEVMAP